MGQGQEEGEEEKVRECSFCYIFCLLTHAKPFKVGASVASHFSTFYYIIAIPRGELWRSERG